MLGVALDQQSLAGVSLRAGRAREARDLLSAMADYVVSCGDPELLATTLEMCAANAAQLRRGPAGGPPRRRRGSHPAEDRHPDQATRNARGVPGPVRATIASEQWDAELAVGRTLDPAAGGRAPRITIPITRDAPANHPLTSPAVG